MSIRFFPARAAPGAGRSPRRTRSCRRGLPLAQLAVVLAAAALWTPARADDDPRPLRRRDRPQGGDEEARIRKNGALEVLGADAAIERSRREYVPLVIYYSGGEEYTPRDADLRALWKRCGIDRRARMLLEKFAVGVLDPERLEGPYPVPAKPDEEGAAGDKAPGEGREARPPEGVAPPPDGRGGRDAGEPREDGDDPGEAPREDDRDAAQNGEDGERAPSRARVLGLTEGLPALVVLDFRETVVRRYQGEAPRLRDFRRLLERVAQVSYAQAALARKVEKEIERAAYAEALKKSRTAVRLLLPLLEPRVVDRLDRVTRDALREIEGKLRGQAREKIDHVLELERKRKYADAVVELEAIQTGYPFPDLVREVIEIRRRILRKARLGF